MRVGKTVTVTTSPKRNVRKAGEEGKPNPWKEQPIPVEIPNKKTKKKVEVEALDMFRFTRFGWGMDYQVVKDSLMYLTAT
jgi:hypothetical protein